MPTPPDFAASLEAALAEAEQAAGPRPYCTIGEIVAGLPPADGERIAGLVRDRSRNYAVIAAALSRVVGKRIAPGTVSRHSRGVCRCPQ